jgi:hypothetical protein
MTKNPTFEVRQGRVVRTAGSMERKEKRDVAKADGRNFSGIKTFDMGRNVEKARAVTPTLRMHMLANRRLRQQNGAR